MLTAPRALSAAAFSITLLSACAAVPMDQPAPVANAAPAPQAPDSTMPQPVAGQPISEFFVTYDAAQLSTSPLTKAYRGIRDGDYGKWDDPSDAAEVSRDQLLQATAGAMRQAFDPAALSENDALSFELFDTQARNAARLFPFRQHGYIFDQMNGAQSELPAFLINIHRVASVDEAQAYIARIRGMGPQLDALREQSAERAAKGFAPPKWVYAYVLNDIANLAGGFENGMPVNSPVLDDFNDKLVALKLGADQSRALAEAAGSAWQESVSPALKRLTAEMQRQQASATTDDGVWRMPGGADYYNALLASYTTTDLDAEAIHNLGLSEVARIHGAMEAIKDKVGFKGTLQQFFAHLRDDPRYYHSTREAYLADVAARVKAMEAALPAWFNTLPKAALVVKPVEAFREKSAGKAFYSSPAPDGSRPGTYYINLYNLRDVPKTELEALAFHEGVPGHHLQRAVQTELTGLPPFRQFGGFTAYTEGWGLYAEELGKDMGFYTDPYSDFGRLAMELWRACRLVTDTGIHAKRWTREEAIAYLTRTTPAPPGDIEKAIERYIVYPGQATAYTIGKLKIVELRERARAKMGGAFDVRAFHDVVLKSGPVPLNVLERRVDAWIADFSR